LDRRKEDREARPPSPSASSQSLLPAFKIENLPAARGKEEVSWGGGAATIRKSPSPEDHFLKQKSNDKRPPTVHNDSTTIETALENCATVLKSNQSY